MKKIMMVGRIGCGKTTLSQCLDNMDLEYKKTQAVEVVGNVIDTPGEFLEMRGLYNALITTSVDADIIFLLQSAIDSDCRFSPGMNSLFQKPVIGIVTKVDEVADKSCIENAETILHLAGAEKTFAVSSFTGEGIDRLKSYIYSEEI